MPLYDQTVREIFAQSLDPEAMVRHWHEFVGYIISQGRNIPLVAICLGRGRNGKTKLMETASRLLGSDLAHRVSIESFEGNRFAIGNLLGKALLVDDDVRSGIKLPDGLLKKLGEKRLTGEHKFREPLRLYQSCGAGVAVQWHPVARGPQPWDVEAAYGQPV